MLARPVLVIVASLAVAGVACSNSATAPSTTVPVPTPTAAPAATIPVAVATSEASTTVPTTTAAPTTTVPPVPPLPAGMQFVAGVPGPGAPSGAVIDGDNWAFTTTVENGRLPCNQPSICGRSQFAPALLVGNPAAGFQSSAAVDDITTLAAPAGTPVAQYITPTGLAHAKLGWVMTGFAYFTDSLAHKLAVRGLIWFSADGQSWTRIDLRDLIGDQTSKMYDVAATDAGFMAVGADGSADLQGVSHPLVVRSTDGVNWSAVELPSTWSTIADQVTVLGSTIVVRGLEFVCTSSSFGLVDFNVGGQERAWRSDDGGGTYTPVDLAASGAYSVSKPAPTDPAACDGLDLNTLATFGAPAGRMRVVGSRLYLLAGDGSAVASTTDLATWTKAELPGASGKGDSLVEAGPGGGASIVRVQRPARSGQPFDFGMQALGWTSDASAATWTPVAAVAPVLGLEPASLVPSLDGRVVMFEPVTAQDGSVTNQVFVSTSAPYVEPPACTFQAGAKCPLATISGTDLSGKDLSGIDLTGATIKDSNFSGSNLSGAILTSASITGGTFTGAKLVQADLRHADVAHANLAGADLTGANLTGGTASLSLFIGTTLTDAALGVELFLDVATPPPAGISFAGLNLTGVTFSNFAPTLIDLHGTDWSGAILAKASFYGLDLTGANFTGADFRRANVGQGTNLTGAVVAGVNIGSKSKGLYIDPPSFQAGVICPDGNGPTTPGLNTFNQCRFAV